MTETLAALVAAFDGALKPTPFPGGVYLNDVPSGTVVYPYCVIWQLPSKPNVRAFGNKILGNPRFQFDAYNSAGALALANIESVAAFVDTLYGAAAPALTGGSFWISCIREAEPFSEYKGKDQKGDDVWMGITRYEILVQKP